MADRVAATGVLLVGGASERFGSPKALAHFRGETLAERGWRLLNDVCEEVVAVGKGDLELPFPVLDDGSVERAPVFGVIAGLRAASHETCLVLPVDTPLVTAALLRELLAARAVPQRGPLPGVYATSLLPELERRVDEGELSLRGVNTNVLDVDEAQLLNVNTPTDLVVAAAEALDTSSQGRPVALPDEAALLDLSSDFWSTALWAAGKLRRGEVFAAVDGVNGAMKRSLVTLLSWHARAVDAQAEVWDAGRFLERWADPGALSALERAYAHYDLRDAARALWETIDLFQGLEEETARRLGLAVLFLAGCGGDDEEPTPSEASQARVYFLLDDQVWPVEREIPEDGEAAGHILDALAAGPNEDEEEIGLTSTFPEGVEVFEVIGGSATVTGGDELTVEHRAQLVYSLTQLDPVVGSVEIDGTSYTRADFEEQTPSVLVESPLPFEEVESPLRVTGTANTFEATFQYELLDSEGNVVDEDFVTATSGTGTRGTFDFTTGEFDDVATLVVFVISAEDGSRANEVEIPLTAAP